MNPSRIVPAAVMALLCACGAKHTAGADAGSTTTCASGSSCNESDGGTDAGVENDAGPQAGPDAGVDAGSPDAGPTGGQDAGSPAGSAADAGPCGCETNGDAGPGAVCIACPAGMICNLSGTCVPPRYTVDADAGTVTDDVTGLVWQQEISLSPCPSDGAGVCTQADAETYCQSLSLGSYTSGWKLPGANQLFSLVDTAGSPVIDATVFPNTPPEWFWTATSSAVTTGYTWIVYFGAGDPSSLAPTGYAAHVRCVQ